MSSYLTEWVDQLIHPGQLDKEVTFTDRNPCRITLRVSMLL